MEVVGVWAADHLPSVSPGKAHTDASAFVLGAAAVWTASQPEMLGGELTDLWPLLQNDITGFLDNVTFLDCEWGRATDPSGEEGRV